MDIETVQKRMKKVLSKDVNIDQNICIICGHDANPCITVSNRHNFVAASGMQLYKFLCKIVGEDPCVSVCDSICQHCFILLDRLDTYQARADEIQNHIITRYKDTKVDLFGRRKRLSELLVASLANIQSIKNGTTLNVSNELSVTVFHGKSKKENDLFNSSSFQNGSLSPVNKSSVFNKHQQKLTGQKRTLLRNSKASVMKKPKRTFAVSSKVNNSDCDNKPDEFNFKDKSIVSPPDCETKISDASTSEQDSLRDSDSDSSNSSSDSSSTTSSNSSSCSDSSDISSSKSQRNPPLKSGSNSKFSNIYGSSENSDGENMTQDVKKRSESSKDSEIVTCDKNSKEKTDPIQSKLTEAVIMQNSFASSLLQSFLSTSLWMGSSEKGGINDSSKPITQKSQSNSEPPENISSLGVDALLPASESINNKKKRLELKNTGQSYINTKGKLVEAKRVWAQDCSRCPLKCNGRLDDAKRQHIFAEYWGLADYNLQREYLAAHMEREEKVGPSGHTRTVILYYLTYMEHRVQVCRQFFLKTLDVSEKASRIVLEKKLKGELGSEEGLAALMSNCNNSGDVVESDSSL